MIARGSLPKLQQEHLYDEGNQHDKNARDNVFEQAQVGYSRIEHTVGCANCDT